MAFIPLICNFVLRDSEGDPAERIQFDSIEAQADPELVDLTIDHMSIEFLDEVDAFTITVEAFRQGVRTVETFVERAFGVPKSRWPHTLDKGFELQFSEDGTQLKVEGPLEVTVDYVEPDGIPSLTFVAADPTATGEAFRVWSWVTADDAVESLIQMNTPGEANPGGL